MNWMMLALLSLPSFAHATTWQLPCRNSNTTLEIRIEPDVWTNYACTEDTGTFADQYFATFRTDATVSVGGVDYIATAGSQLGGIHRISCDLLQGEFNARETIFSFTAQSAESLRSVHVFRNFDGYLIVHFFEGAHELELCEGYSRN